MLNSSTATRISIWPVAAWRIMALASKYSSEIRPCHVAHFCVDFNDLGVEVAPNISLDELVE